jgi:hypothetical protein
MLGCRPKIAHQDRTKRLIPTGKRWCGCGQEVSLGTFFAGGHDKVAESAVIMVEFGGVANFLHAHEYRPGGKNPRDALRVLKRQPAKRQGKRT